MQLYWILGLFISLILAGKSYSREKYLVSKYNRHEPVVVYSTAKPKHNILVGRKHQQQHLSDSISIEAKKCHRKEKAPKYSVSYSSTSWTSSSDSHSSYASRRHHRQRKVVVKKR